MTVMFQSNITTENHVWLINIWIQSVPLKPIKDQHFILVKNRIFKSWCRCNSWTQTLHLKAQRGSFNIALERAKTPQYSEPLLRGKMWTSCHQISADAPADSVFLQKQPVIRKTSQKKTKLHCCFTHCKRRFPCTQIYIQMSLQIIQSFTLKCGSFSRLSVLFIRPHLFDFGSEGLRIAVCIPWGGEKRKRLRNNDAMLLWE